MLDLATTQCVDTQPVAALDGGNHHQCIRVECPRWAVLATYPQAEAWAEANLRQRGFEPYLPRYTTQVRDRAIRSLWHTVQRPLFTSYIFCQHNPADPWRPIRYCPGIRANLLGGNELQYASSDAVEAVRAAEAAGRCQLPEKMLWRPGAACRLGDGAFQGHEAVVLTVTRNNATVALMMFGCLRNVSVTLNCLMPRD